MQSLRAAHTLLRRQLGDAPGNSTVQDDGNLKVHSGSSTTYQGIWPDDFIYPLIIDPSFLDPEVRRAVIEYITDCCIDLERVPDRVEGRGLVVMQPGAIHAPHAVAFARGMGAFAGLLRAVGYAHST